ncbi:hypothetical protein YC2023_012119 [Brassica napus]
MVSWATLKTLLDLFMMHHELEEHHDVLYLNSSGLSSHILIPPQKCPKDQCLQKMPEELVRQWEDIKAEPLGPTYLLPSCKRMGSETIAHFVFLLAALTFLVYWK